LTGATIRPLGPLADVAPALGGRLDRLLHDEAPREVLFGTFLFVVAEVLAAGVIAPPVQTWLLVEAAAMARRLGLEQPVERES